MVVAMEVAVATDSIGTMEVATGTMPTLAMETGVVAVEAVAVAEGLTEGVPDATGANAMAMLLLIVPAMVVAPVWQPLLWTPMRLF